MQQTSGLFLSCACLVITGCTTAPVAKGALSNYENLMQQKGMLSKRRVFADAALLKQHQEIYIAPINFATNLPQLTQAEQRLLANALSRALCDRVEDKAQIVEAPGAATLRIAITITELERTNVAAASAAVIALRAPIGLGALGVEAEALTGDDRQAASMMWRRKADAVFTGARASSIGDAFNFAGQFGHAFGGELRRGFGERQFKNGPTNPCQRFGSTRASASLLELISPIQLPPSWEEKQPKEAKK